VVCPTAERAERARDLAAVTLAGLGLRLHPDKTKIVCLRQGQDGFDFLGFHHHMVESWKRPGRYYLQKWPSPRAMASIRAKIRDRTPRGYAMLDMAVVVENLNPVLRGWGNYFRYLFQVRITAGKPLLRHRRHRSAPHRRRSISGVCWVSSGRIVRLAHNPSHCRSEKRDLPSTPSGTKGSATRAIPTSKPTASRLRMSHLWLRSPLG